MSASDLETDLGLGLILAIIAAIGGIGYAIYYLITNQNVCLFGLIGPGCQSPDPSTASNPIANLAADLGLGTANIPLGGGPQGSTVASGWATSALGAINCITSFGSNCSAADTNSGGDDGEAGQ
jgi:hypothetical protein